MNPYARWIQNLPRVDTPFDGLEGRMISGPEGQAVFFRAAERFEVPPHAHGAQWGIVVTGLLHLTVDGAPATYRPGETYDIPAGAEHSAILESETCVIDVFQDSDRYSPEKQRPAEAVKDHQLIPWTQPGWFGRVSAQVHAKLQRQGITVSGPIEQPHSYPWSTVLRVPTGEGNVFFKAVSPAHPHEPALIEALARWSPDQVPRLLSVDTERGWILMRDAGRRLRARSSDP